MYSTPHPAPPLPIAKTQYRKFETNIPRILKNIKINNKNKVSAENIGLLRVRNPTIGIDIFKVFFIYKTYKSIWPESTTKSILSLSYAILIRVN
jgi:hypothetical protein